MNKIGILTFHYVINEGALLQTLGVLNAFKDTFHARVEIINYHSVRKEIGNLYLTLHSGYKNKMLAKSIRRYVRLKLNSRKLFKNHISGLPWFSDNYFKSIARIDKKKYDLITVGSDEVWRIDFESNNIMVLPWPNVYWLHGSLQCAKISYAPSANRSNIVAIKPYQKLILKDLLSNYDLVSVRDNFTLEMLGEFNSGRPISKIPDPSFYLELSPTRVEDKLKSKGLAPGRKIVLCVINSETISRYVRKYCDDNNFTMIAIEDANKYADFSLIHDLDILEWADIYRLASLCVTDRFHGTIFSLKQKNTPVIALGESAPDRCKIFNLLREMDLLNIYRHKSSIKSQEDFNQAAEEVSSKWDSVAVEQKIEEQKKIIRTFLSQIATKFPGQ